jgi:alkanesulfonate monooxygenase SsuD/methylene tetrahydromethanopterin reductase-like flavin-dependent oxidoreductase (luciferase family)
LLARQAASLDLLTGGRFEMGLGAGGNWDAISAFGGERRDPAEAVAATEEAIAVMRAVWGTGPATVDGSYHAVRRVRPGPAAPHVIPIVIGAYGPRMLEIVGKTADGWLPSLAFVPPDRLDRRHTIIDEAARAAGRNPGDVARMYNVGGLITDRGSEGFLRGPENQWVDQLRWLHRDHRIDTFILWPEGDVVDQVRRFASVAERMRSLA